MRYILRVQLSWLRAYNHWVYGLRYYPHELHNGTASTRCTAGPAGFAGKPSGQCLVMGRVPGNREVALLVLEWL